MAVAARLTARHFLMLAPCSPQHSTAHSPLSYPRPPLPPPKKKQNKKNPAQITTEAVAAAGPAFLPEEPSLWRDYDGRENARDRGVLARSNRTVRLAPGDGGPSAAKGLAEPGDLVYALDVEVGG